MTKEEAIDLLDNLIGMIEDNHNSDYDTALQMGIKALEQEPAYCDRNICLKNEYTDIGCDECEVTKSQDPKTQMVDKCRTCKYAFTTGKDRWYCKKSLADKDDCGEYEIKNCEEVADEKLG